jgi:hypothetical protein
MVASMTGKERMTIAMRLGRPDRSPVMCQLSLGHYFLQTGLDPIEIWHSSEAFGDALILLQQRYGFDGILVNLPGRDPAWRRHVLGISQRGTDKVIRWNNGWHTVAPVDDNPHVYRESGLRYFPTFDELNPEKLFYVEPHDLSGITYPYSWGFSSEPAPPGLHFFPAWHYDTLRYVLARSGGEVSVHGEVFSPFSQLMELLDYTNALMALMEDPSKVHACLDRLSEGTIQYARGIAETGADAILISSAFAGAGLISRKHYSEYVLPYERKVIQGIRDRFNTPVYTHTCGAIGDRLDLMEATGTDGIDTLDPPPLGNIELKDAKCQTEGRLFIKGNLDPVHVLLQGKPEEVLQAAGQCIRIGGRGGGYILSTACSVAPHTPPENILQLRHAVEHQD